MNFTNHDKLIDIIFFKNDLYNKSNANKYNKRKNKKYNNILNYLLNRFNDTESERETIYRIHYNIENKPLCPVCGKKLKFNGRKNSIFLSHCSHQCKKLDKDVNKKWKESCGEKGTNREKAKNTMIKKYGVENPYQIFEIIEKIKKINKEKNKESLQKREITNIQKYGVKSYLQTNEFKEKSKITSLNKYGVDHPMKSNIIKEKYNLEEISKKIIITKEKNHTFNTSNEEDISYELIKIKYPDVIRQYKDNRYPFLCDFYIPSLDLFIECQYGWQHGKHPYIKEYDKNRYNEIKNKNTKYYNNVLYNWTIRDVNKRNIAKQNKLNYIEFWNIEELKKWIELPLYLVFDWDLIKWEYNYFKTKEGNLKGSTSFNYIVKYYQQDIFFKNENELYKNDNIKEKLIFNRIKYLKKDRTQLTNNDLLLGFKRSGIYYGYSHFNPLIFKYFIEKYNVKICYDPCGGWGHRLLGSNKLEKYIYNDLSNTIYKNTKRIAKDLNINNVVFFNNDANYFIPNYDFDSMFSCPPYFNLEKYECKEFENIFKYNDFIDNLFKVFYNKESCKIFGLVIREDLLEENHKNIIFEKILIENKNSKHFSKSIEHKNNEYLYIFKK